MENNSDTEVKCVVAQYSPLYQGKGLFFGYDQVRKMRGRITTPIYKDRHKYYFASDVRFKGGDIITIGKSIKIKYRVKPGKFTRTGGFVMGIERVDCYPINTWDIANSEKGALIILYGVLSADEILQKYNEL